MGRNHKGEVIIQIAIASDHAGYSLKLSVIEQLKKLGHDVTDYGCFSEERCNSIDFAPEVCRAVASIESGRGILICGTGIGMSIIANKFNGIRAALCGDTFSARATRQHNNANVLTLGARVIGKGLALDIVKIFMQTEFLAGDYEKRVNRITELEKQRDR